MNPKLSAVEFFNVVKRCHHKGQVTVREDGVSYKCEECPLDIQGELAGVEELPEITSATTQSLLETK